MMEADTGWSPPPPPPPWRGCHLDREECLTLEQILQSFSAPISEEHAWAVIHQVGHHQLERFLIVVGSLIRGWRNHYLIKSAEVLGICIDHFLQSLSLIKFRKRQSIMYEVKMHESYKIESLRASNDINCH